MIQSWLVRKAGVAPLIDRVALLERELTDAKATIVSLNERVSTTEAYGAAAAGAHERLDRQLRIVTRAVRAGTARLRHLISSDIDQAAHGKGLEKELRRLNAAVLVVENRVEAEAEQAQKSILELFRTTATIRARDRTGASG
jgi:hypothetical protein